MNIRLLIKYSALGVILIVSGIFAFLLTLDINQYKPVLISTVSTMTGRELHIDGDLKLMPSLTPTISVQGIALANAPWSGSGMHLLTVGRVEARAALLPLLSGRIHIEQFILHDSKLSLETDAEGRGNWVMGSDTTGPVTTPQTDSTMAMPAISIDQIDIRNADIAYTDGRTALSNHFNIRELTTGVNDTDSPLSFTLNAAYDDYSIQLNGKLGSINTLLANQTYPVNVNGRLADTFNLQLTGTIAQPLDAAGIDVKITASTERLANLNRFGASGLPAISPVSLSGNLKFSDPANIDIDTLAVQLGSIGLAGRLSYHTRDTLPLLTLQLQSDLIDLLPFSDPSGEDKKQQYLFPRDPLPLAPLSMLDIDASLTAKQLKSKSATLDDLQLAIKLTNGDLLATLKSAIAGGKMDGTLKLNSSSQLPSSSIELAGTEIKLGQLPHDANKPWFSDGPIDIQISGGGNGNSIAEIAGGFNGKILVQVGKATMPNSSVDLFGADLLMSIFNKVNPLAGREKTTVLECAVINLQIRDGIAKIDRQIAMQTSKMNMAGSGEINFKTEQLNLGVKPYAREGIGINLGDIASFAKIGGTLANPHAEVDSQGAMKAGLTAGAAVATGGLSLLAQGLYNKKTRDPAPCETALGKKTPATETQQQPPAGTTAEEKKEGLFDNVKGGFKKLFGN